MAGVCVPTVGLGSTPTSSHPTDAMRELSELHPGNYIFYGRIILLVYITVIHSLSKRCKKHIGFMCSLYKKLHIRSESGYVVHWSSHI